MTFNSLQTPPVSVVMAVHNGERFLRDSIDSILNQTFADFEFIIVDDGSTDGTAAILDSYTDTRIRLIRNDKTRGLSTSLNRGTGTAEGTFIARMDGDDISLPERFARQVAYLTDHPHIDVLGTWFTHLTHNGEHLNTIELPLTHGMIAWSLLFFTPISHPTAIIRRAVLQRVGGYNTDYPLAQDYELWTRLIHQAQFANLPEALVLYRIQTDEAKKRRQRAASKTALLKWLADLLGEQVSPDVIDWLVEVTDQALEQRTRRTVPVAQSERLIALLIQVYQALKTHDVITGNEESILRADMARRVTRIGQCTVPFWYWKLLEFVKDPVQFVRHRWQKIVRRI
jgi:hypothetical protein